MPQEFINLKDMSILVFLLAFLFSINCLSQGNSKDTCRTINCEYKTYYHSTGEKKEEGYLINREKEGIWFGYGVSGKYYFLTTYKNGIKNGIFKMYYVTGELREVGSYRNNCRVDTSIVFKKDGDTIAKFYSEPLGFEKSVIKWRKYYNKDAKPDGIFENKDGVNYIWQIGEMIEFKYKKN